MLVRFAMIAVLLCACGDATEGPSPSGLTVVTAPASGTPGDTLDSVVLRVEDENGEPVAGRVVHFEVSQGGGTVTPAHATSGSDGLVAVRWVLGFLPGTNELGARILDEPATLIRVDGVAFRADAVAAGSGFACGIRAGETWCWSPDDRPYRSMMGIAARAVAAGFGAACVLDGGGLAWCGSPDGAPSRISGLPAMRTLVSSGDAGYCGLAAADSTAWCWDLRGGVAHIDASRRFVQLDGGGDLGFAAYPFVCGLDGDQRAWCWGRGNDGQLGDGLSQNSDVFVAVAGNRRYLSITAGSRHACAVEVGWALYCWGAAEEAPLIEELEGSPVPVFVAQGAGTATAGDGSVLAAFTGRVRGWGGSFFRDPGAPGYGLDRSLLALSELPILEIASGYGSCVRAATGDVYCSEGIAFAPQLDNFFVSLVDWAAIPVPESLP